MLVLDCYFLNFKSLHNRLIMIMNFLGMFLGKEYLFLKHLKYISWSG